MSDEAKISSEDEDDSEYFPSDTCFTCNSSATRAEARGYQAAIDALRDHEATERYLLKGNGGAAELRLVRAILRPSEWAADYLASRKDTQA